ncbi:MAG: hypothetical protein H3Z50_07085 [archaeon]|nr:hypothetical protein [archaeon]
MPQDFGGMLNIVVIAFRREHQNLVDGWIPFIDDLVKENPNLAFYELPTLQRSYSIFRRWIDGGMRGGIRDEEARKRTITLYIDKKEFKKQLNITSENTIHILLINKDGQVVWRTEGGFTEQKFDILKEAIEKIQV